jgi:hypothetical protein
MNENTEKIRILIYNSNLSPRNDQYCFYLQHKQDKQGNGLGEIENIIQEKLVARDREHEASRVKEELAAIKQQLEEAEEYIATLEEKLELALDSKYKLKNIDLVDLGTLVLGKFAEKHADVLSQVGLEGLAAGKPRSLPEAPPAEGAAAFEKKKEGPLKPEYLQYVPVLQQLDAAFDQKQLATVMQVLEKFSEEPANLKTVADLLNIQNP